jgi:uncharacterized protein
MRTRPTASLGAFFIITLAAGCEMTGPGHERAGSPSVPASKATDPLKEESSKDASRGVTTTAAGRCVVPRVEPPPPVAPPAASCPADPGNAPVLARGAVRFTEAPSAPRITVELALDDAAHTRGLMYRTRLDADAGMLFSWDQEQPRSFWMRNTCIPLDMLFLAADGTIVGILEQVPTLNTLPRGVPCPAAHVLEVNAGWTRQHGVVPGQKVDIET